MGEEEGTRHEGPLSICPLSTPSPLPPLLSLKPRCSYPIQKHSPAYPTVPSTELKTTSETVSNRPQCPLFITQDQQGESLLRPDCLSMSTSNNCQLSVSSQTSQLPEPAKCGSLGQDLSFSLFSERERLHGP